MTDILEIYNIEKAYKQTIEVYKRLSKVGIVFTKEQKKAIQEYKDA